MIEFTFWDIARNLLFATRWTVLLSAAAFAGGAIVGIAILFARISPAKWAKRFGSGYIALFQGTPLLMQLFLMFFGLPMLGLRIEPWTAAVCGLTFYASAYLAEIWRSGVEALPRGQSEAASSLGLHRFQELRLIILPQAFRAMVPLLLTQGIVLVQDTSLVYVLSLADFFRTASTIGERDGTQVEMILFAGGVYFVISLSASLLVSWLKKRTV